MCFLVLSADGDRVFAEDGNYLKKYKNILIDKVGVDVMFVIDSSYSMNSTDSKKYGLEMLKLFSDISPSESTRVGFVSYNDRILSSKGLTQVDTEERKKEIRKYVDSISRWGNTDMGLGLRTGFQILSDSQSNNQKILIMLSDGETHSSSAERTKYDSDMDIEYVIQESSKKDIPIYTVALGDEEGEYLETLKNISSSTGGEAYELNDPRNLLEVYEDILEKHFSLQMIPFVSIKASGDYEELEVELPNEYIREGNIIFLSDGSIKGAQVYSNSSDVNFYNSKNFYSIKVKDPKKEKVKIQFKGESDELIKVFMLFDYNIRCSIDMIGTDSKSRPIKGALYLEGGDNRGKILDEDFYKRLELEASAQEKASGEIKDIPVEMGEKGFTFQHSFMRKGEYIIRLKLTGDSIYYTQEDIKVLVVNHAPEGSMDESVSLVKSGKKHSVPLKGRYTDKDGDKLSYRLLSWDEKMVEPSMDEDNLMVKVKAVGTSEISFAVEDTEGERLIQKVRIKGVSIFEEYIDIFIGIFGIILVAGLIAFFKLRKKHVEQMAKETFTGRLNIYFLNLSEDAKDEYDNIPPIFFMLYKLNPRKRVPLSEILNEKKVDMGMKELEKMYFKAYEDNRIQFYHNTGCTIMIGQEMACRGKEYTLDYGNKIFMILGDNITEMEIHFKRSSGTPQD